MNRFSLSFIVFILCFAGSQIVYAQSGNLSQRGICADTEDIISTYHRQMENHTYDKLVARRKYLLQNTPPETLIDDLILRGAEAVSLDTISLHDLLNLEYTHLSKEERCDLANHIYTVAEQRKSPELKLTAEYWKAHLAAGYPDSFPGKMEPFERIIKDAQRTGNRYIEVLSITWMWFSSFYTHYHTYPQACAYASRLAETLDRTADDFPYKGIHYIYVGMNYYRFHDYDKALHYLTKGLSYRAPGHILFGEYYLKAWNHLASYHTMKGNADSAAYYHRTILEAPESLYYSPDHLTVALCNLGKIEMNRGNYDNAIAIFRTGIPNLDWDASFRSGTYTSMGECFLQKGDLPAVKACIDSAANAIANHYNYDFYNRRKDLYALYSNYHACLGEGSQAAAMLDSAMRYTRLYQEATGEHIILRGEQLLQQAETEKREQHIAWQKRIITHILILLIVIAIAMLVFINYHRKVQRAYKALAENATRWANKPSAGAGPVALSMQGSNEGDTGAADEEDRELVARANRLMDEEKPYKNAAFTIDTMAEILGVRRNLLSRAINRTTGNNFNQYLHEYRIREAIRLLSLDNRNRLSMEQIIEQCGYSTRSSFYNVFKKFTGLNPAEYRRQRAWKE